MKERGGYKAFFLGSRDSCINTFINCLKQQFGLKNSMKMKQICEKKSTNLTSVGQKPERFGEKYKLTQIWERNSTSRCGGQSQKTVFRPAVLQITSN